MRVSTKFLVIFFLLFSPLVCFAQTIEKPALVVKVNTETLILDIKDAHLVKGADGFSGIYIELSPSAAEQLAKLSGANIGKVMSISYGNNFTQKATLQSPIHDKFLISHFPEKEGRALIDSLKKPAK